MRYSHRSPLVVDTANHSHDLSCGRENSLCSLLLVRLGTLGLGTEGSEVLVGDCVCNQRY